MTNNTNNRPTGTTVQLLDLTKLNSIVEAKTEGDFETIAFQFSGVIFNSAGEMRTINQEGVQDKIDDEGKIAVYTAWGWIDFTPEEIKSAISEATIDLSKMIRVFGQRLETNFYIAREWATS